MTAEHEADALALADKARRRAARAARRKAFQALACGSQEDLTLAANKRRHALTGELHLTQKQWDFVYAYCECGNGAEAWRRSHPDSQANPATVSSEVRRMLRDPAIRYAVQELRKAVITRKLVDLETVTEMLLEDRKLAHDNAQAGAAVAASMGLAKLHGLVVDRVQRQTTVLDRLSYAELQALEQALAAIQDGTGQVAAILGEGVLPDPQAPPAVPIPDSPTEPAGRGAPPRPARTRRPLSGWSCSACCRRRWRAAKWPKVIRGSGASGRRRRPARLDRQAERL